MTERRYPLGYAAWLQVCGKTSSPYANNGNNTWIVNFNNGNNNNNYVRVVRFGECPPGAVASPAHGSALDFCGFNAAWRHARHRKKSRHNQLAFESRRLDGLLSLGQRLLAHVWHLSPTLCLVPLRPKAREIHAPDISDLAMYHWLAPHLERVFEPIFIHDTYANRKGKGTHSSVRQVRDFVRQVLSGKGGGWYLQLDIHDSFNSIQPATVYGLLKKRLTADAPVFTPTYRIGGQPAGLEGNGGGLSMDQVAEKMSWLLSAPPPAPHCLPPCETGGKTAWGETVQHIARTPQGRAIHADQRLRAAILWCGPVIRAISAMPTAINCNRVFTGGTTGWSP